MSSEITQPTGEQIPLDPVQQARRDLFEVFRNANVEGEERKFNGLMFVNRLTKLKKALEESNGEPGSIYQELAIHTTQGVFLAEEANDALSTETLLGMQGDFQTSSQFFNRIPAENQMTPQANVDNLPAMTGTKGILPQRPESIPAVKKAPEEKNPQSGEAEETLRSFLKGKRNESGRTQKDVGKKAGNLPQSMISAFERGFGQLTEEQVTQLGTSLNLNEEDMQKAMDLYKKEYSQE